MKRKGLLLICLIISLNLYAQFSSSSDFVTRIWTTADGLPANSVSSVIQTSDGYMYFGTYEGLVKFDGYDFITINKYSDYQGKKYGFVSARALLEDSEGNLWVGSNDEGVYKIEGDSCISFTTADGLCNNSVRSLAEDKNHNIWVGTASGIVYITPSGKIEKPECVDDVDLSHVLVEKLYCDTAGRIWMLTNDVNGLYIYGEKAFVRYKDLDFMAPYNASGIGQDSSGTFWFSLGAKGIVKINTSLIAPVKTDTILDTMEVFNIYCDSSGALWFGAEKGLVCYKNGEFSEFTENASFRNTTISSIIGDREGNIWVTTDSTGVGKISPGKFRMKNIDSPVNSIAEGKDGLVWIGSDRGLLCYKNEEEITNELTQYCGGTRVRHVAVTEEGDVLVNCYTKPSQVIMTKEGIKSWSTDNGLVGDKTRVSLKINNGDIYCGTTKGLSVIHKDGSIANFTVEQGFECDYIMSLYQDANGIVWVGTDGGGIYLLKDEKIIRNISTSNGLIGNVVFKISQDKDKNYWVCTGSGLTCIFALQGSSIYDKNERLPMCSYTSADGLGSDSIFQLLVDDNDFAWMVSNRGISSVPFYQFKEFYSGIIRHLDCKFYTVNDGLKSSGTNSTALSMKDRYGRLWFTMADGFAIYDPVRARSVKVLPIIQLLEVQVDDVKYNKFDEPIIIPPNAKHIDVRYTGLSYTASERNRFSYKLEGFDNNFCEYTSNRHISYTNLPFGKYTFYVNVINAEDLACSSPAKVVFFQQAYFWQRPWFWICIASILIVFVIVLFVIINVVNKRRQLLLQSKIDMATVELKIAKDESDRLLESILPTSIANELKQSWAGEYKTIADHYDEVTVLFSDIVSFTDTTSNYSAEDIVSSLNDLIRMFDKRAKKMGVEKIKTIGDAYMAACGVPVPNEHHAEVMLKFAVGMYKDLAKYNETAKIKFHIRVGINSGPVIAGIIGENKFIYDIWGDTVNVASRMETNCNPGHIRLTEAVKAKLEKDNHHFEYREEIIDVKGKGLMTTYELPKN